MIFERGALDTAPNIQLEELGIEAPERSYYAPSGWFFVRRALRGRRITERDVFVDFGSGMGRAICCAARWYPFGRVVGVEIAQELNDVASENIRRMRGKLRCKDIEVITSDALDFPIPDDMTYAYFFNPFIDGLFEQLLERIVESLDRNPRSLTICYANPAMEDAILRTGRFRKVKSTNGFRPDLRFYRINVYDSVA